MERSKSAMTPAVSSAPRNWHSAAVTRCSSQRALGCMTHLARHSLIGVVFTLACSLPAAAAGESTLFPVAWPSEYGGESAPVTAAAERLLLERDPVVPDEAPVKPDSADEAECLRPARAAGPGRPIGGERPVTPRISSVIRSSALQCWPRRRKASPAGADEDKRNGFKEWRENVSKPVWDDDSWWLNYVTHPYWGGTYYIRARERGLDRWQSFWYSALLSTLWEFGVEAVAEPVSIQDMIVTPVLGSLVGEYLFSPWRAHIRAKAGPLSWSDKAVLVLTDPLGTINDQLDRWLGVKTSLQLQPIVARSARAHTRPSRHPCLRKRTSSAGVCNCTWRGSAHDRIGRVPIATRRPRVSRARRMRLS